MSQNNSSLKKRILTALILLPVALFAIFDLPLWGFSVFCAVVMSIGAWEWGPFIGFSKKRLRLALMALLVGIIALLFTHFRLFDIQSSELTSQIGFYLLLSSVIWWGIAALLVVSYPKSALTWRQKALLKMVFGFLTLVPTWFAATLIRSANYNEAPQYGAWLLLFVMGLVWAADIGAYFAGKAYGKNKLMPNVSPGKTIEGMLGGLVAAFTVVFIVGQTALLDNLSIVQMGLISLAVVISSVLGDLLESMLKRQAGIKDSGTILPGHGGILDRIDSLTAALPVFAFLFFFVI
ncbi:phosphatidate cytidylyltransferase [Algibacillus agarilyticus]|uniref:phosphatidate cytidylyltransferase n=1 Tax=Algibacillus agarilyticus TaxID=2234133 RepID=UPI000DD0406C|nr:phosphatidate cytidylyltransferase [Algibacillus agarilyticus]